MNRGARSLLSMIICGLCLAGSGCAYYNTLYNARQKFDEALDVKRRADPERDRISAQEEKLYQESFDRAARVVKYWPESKWVDDALLLMGRSAYEKGDYSTALRKFDEILTIFPDSDLAARARLEKGRTLIATRDFGPAVSELDRVAHDVGDKFRPDVLHHLGIVRQAQGDSTGALAAWTEVADRYDGSEWLGPAALAAGDLERGRGRLHEAASFYDKLRKRGKTAEERFLGGMRKGEALLELGETGRARSTFHDVAKNAVNEERRGEALLAEAGAVAAAGDTVAAVTKYQEVLAAYPRKAAAAEAQFAIAKLKDDTGDLAGAREAYELVKEQGTGHEAWLRATGRITEIQQVLDLRAEVAEEGPDRNRSRYLLAEQLLEKLGDVDGALAQYDTLATEAHRTEWGAKALYAKAWVLEHRLQRKDAADSALFRLANGYAGSEVDAFARRRLGYPVWKVEKIEPPKIAFIRPAGGSDVTESLMERVEPRDVPLPEGTSAVEVWVRVHLSRDGSVEETKVVKSGGGEFDDACLTAARASRFVAPDEGGPEITVVRYLFPRVAAPPAAEGAPPPNADAPRDTAPPPDANRAQNASPLPPGVGGPDAAAEEPIPFSPPDSTNQGAPPADPAPIPSIRDRKP